MKKLSPFVLLTVLALLLGLGIGLYIFSEKPQAPKRQLKIAYTDETLAHEGITIEETGEEESVVARAIVKKVSIDSLWAAFDEMIIRFVIPGNKSCLSKLSNMFSEKDYIDPAQISLKKHGSHSQAVSLLNDILKTVETSEGFHELYLDLLYNIKTDPQKLQAKMSESVICSDVKITNFTTALIMDIARTPMEPELKAELTRELVDVAFRYLISAPSVEYTSSAMEILFSLADTELIPRSSAEDLSLIRQNLINIIQNYESDFRPQGAAVSNLEVMQDFYEELNQLNTSILDLIERLKSELPKGR